MDESLTSYHRARLDVLDFDNENDGDDGDDGVLLPFSTLSNFMLKRSQLCRVVCFQPSTELKVPNEWNSTPLVPLCCGEWQSKWIVFSGLWKRKRPDFWKSQALRLQTWALKRPDPEESQKSKKNLEKSFCWPILVVDECNKRTAVLLRWL